MNNTNTNINANSEESSSTTDPSDLFNLGYSFNLSDGFKPNFNDQSFLGSEGIPHDFFQFVTDASSSAPVADISQVPPTTNTDPYVESDGEKKPESRASSVSNSVTNSGFSPAASLERPMAMPSRTSSVLAGQKRRRVSEDWQDQAVFTLVVGGRIFRVSWESLKSDGPNNFFTNYFRKQKTTRTMYIDRDADIFAIIIQHLRGYHVRPRDDLQNCALLKDAQYYGLKRLTKILQEFLYINVGGRPFRLSWELLRKNGPHNFFTGPLMHSLFDPHGTGVEAPPIYIDRDPDNFEAIINHLRGYTIYIKDEMHRKNLLKDASYYALRGLMEKLLTARKTVDGFGEQGSPEVLLLLQDVRVRNLLPTKAEEKGFALNVSPQAMGPHDWGMAQLQYKREESPHALLVQMSDFCMQIHYTTGFMATVDMGEADQQKLKSIAQTVKAAGGVNQRIYLDEACAITVDDREIRQLGDLVNYEDIQSNWEPCTKCSTSCQLLKLILRRGMMSVHIVDEMVTLCAVRLEAISSRLRLNQKREFLPGS
ncbi:uncharacterized protein BYT42DRAFT_614357 [Radiomyces spectabilis]|uniref:uncharacterized protein n=1 Tax=Radiomyces spectabilis TaxID=64574 RepID=UPI00221F1700|nr:uncharacterized protein BYT42DRAFT_614357 [Radiomyces spectabilis]KAI8377694.1 hypothetical protein BYT42DRAFT_614357 [Radiomyces spectabilis]